LLCWSYAVVEKGSDLYFILHQKTLPFFFLSFPLSFLFPVKRLEKLTMTSEDSLGQDR